MTKPKQKTVDMCDHCGVFEVEKDSDLCRMCRADAKRSERMTIKRYDPLHADEYAQTMGESPEGGYVTYEDYEAAIAILRVIAEMPASTHEIDRALCREFLDEQ